MNFQINNIKIEIGQHRIVSNSNKYILIWKDNICILHRKKQSDIEIIDLIKDI